MSYCPDKCPQGFPADLYKLLMQFPAFRYLKPPVHTVSDLYERYPGGCERGAFAYVEKDNSFYTWNFETKTWKIIGGGGSSTDFTFAEDLPVSIRKGKSFGKWVNGDIIPAKGKTVAEVIIEALTEEFHGTIYYGDTDYAPTTAEEVLNLQHTDAGNVGFTITPMKKCNVIAFPADLVQPVSVISVNGEPWYNPLVDADYYTIKSELSIMDERYQVLTMYTDLPMEIPANIEFTMK